MLSKILAVFLNTLTADGKYAVEDWENCQLPMQMLLSEKHSTFSQFFFPLLESTSNSKHFEKKKIIVIANVFPKLQTVKNFDKTPSKEHRFGTRFDRQHVKVSHILAKSP